MVIKFFEYITASPQKQNFGFAIVSELCRRRLVGRLSKIRVCCRAVGLVISTAIPGREHGTVLGGGPTANTGTHGLTTFGRKSSQVEAVPKGSVSRQLWLRTLGSRTPGLRTLDWRRGLAAVGEHGSRAQGQDNYKCVAREFLHDGYPPQFHRTTPFVERSGQANDRANPAPS